MKTTGLKYLKAAALAAVLGVSAIQAKAHTIAIGSSFAGPGNVTLWMGTYSHGGPISQGSITLTSGPSNVGAFQAFTFVVGTLPAGLIAGTNYFFADAQGSGQWGTLAYD